MMGASLHRGGRPVQAHFPSVAIQYKRGGVQTYAQADPQLPVRKGSGDIELARQTHIGGQTPESQRVSHQRGRDE